MKAVTALVVLLSLLLPVTAVASYTTTQGWTPDGLLELDCVYDIELRGVIDYSSSQTSPTIQWMHRSGMRSVVERTANLGAGATRVTAYGNEQKRAFWRRNESSLCWIPFCFMLRRVCLS